MRRVDSPLPLHNYRINYRLIHSFGFIDILGSRLSNSWSMRNVQIAPKSPGQIPYIEIGHQRCHFSIGKWTMREAFNYILVNVHNDILSHSWRQRNPFGFESSFGWAIGLGPVGQTTGIAHNGISWIGSRYSISTCDITCSVLAMKLNLETIAHTNKVDEDYSYLEHWLDAFHLIERITRSASW